MGETLVEHHGNVRAELRLNVGSLFRGEQMFGAIKVRSEPRAVLGDGPAGGKAEDLILPGGLS